MKKDSSIYIAGHNGMVGSAITRKLRACGYHNLIFKTSAELDLRNQSAVNSFLNATKPDYLFLAAARVGGIIANSNQKAEFLYDNLMIQTNVIHAAWQSKVKRLLFLGSTCIYPKHAPQPLKEEYLLTGTLEPTNDAYAIAKIAGIAQCRAYNQQYGTAFLSAMPNNLYGPGDNFDLTSSHVLPALLRKAHEAKTKNSPYLDVWGSGTPLRELMHVDDLADAALFLMNLNDADYQELLYNPTAPALINIGSGEEVSIADLAKLIQQIVGYSGEVRFDNTKPDGTPRKLADSSRLHALGWQHRISLENGIKDAYQWFCNHHNASGK